MISHFKCYLKFISKFKNGFKPIWRISFKSFSIVDLGSSIDWEELDDTLVEAQLHSLFDACALRHVLLFHVDQERQVGVQVVVTVDMLQPWHILDFEL